MHFIFSNVTPVSYLMTSGRPQVGHHCIFCSKDQPVKKLLGRQGADCGICRVNRNKICQCTNLNPSGITRQRLRAIAWR